MTAVQPGDFRALPSVDRLMSDPRIRRLVAEFSHEAVVRLVREELEMARSAISAGRRAPGFDELVSDVEAKVALWLPGLRRVINATGVIIHTNLGRAPLSREAILAMQEVAGGYSNLEYDLAAGERGSRYSHVESLLCQVTGAEAAMVVNNNASAVLLALSALAAGREVIVSRGQAVEIGGGFRIPDVMRQSGARLVEVGTTNRTYIRDYEAAITPDTALLLRVHTSNFRVIGFTHEVSLSELVDLGRRHGLPVLEDLGSGCLIDTRSFGLHGEPLVQESIAAGVGLACFSGDKLLGGPQAGILVGRRDLIDRVKRHALARAVRIDKLTLAALGATLLHYLKGEALEKIPIWRMIARSPAEIKETAYKWATALHEVAQVQVVEGQSTVGGGSLPGETLSTWLLAIGSEPRPALLAARLRSADPPVVARIERDLLLIDPRTVLAEEEEELLRILREAIKGALNDKGAEGALFGQAS